MPTDQNSVNFRRIPEEIFNQGKLELIDELFIPDYVEHVPLPPGFPSGAAGLKQFVSMIRTAFPDFHYTIEDLFGEGEKYAGRIAARGTHQNEFMGIPATGKKAQWAEIHIARMVNGKLVKHWAVQDTLGMLQQLGVIPTPGQ